MSSSSVGGGGGGGSGPGGSGPGGTGVGGYGVGGSVDGRGSGSCPPTCKSESTFVLAASCSCSASCNPSWSCRPKLAASCSAVLCCWSTTTLLLWSSKTSDQYRQQDCCVAHLMRPALLVRLQMGARLLLRLLQQKTQEELWWPSLG